MEIAFLPQAERDYEYWEKSGNVKIRKRILKLLEDIKLHPFTGIGKPEPLKHNLKGVWSRRINDEHRILYRIEDNMIYVYVLSMRFHYGH